MAGYSACVCDYEYTVYVFVIVRVYGACHWRSLSSIRPGGFMHGDCMLPEEPLVPISMILFVTIPVY